MATPPVRTALADTYPNPSNATFRTGIGALWDTLFASGGLLGSTGNSAEARDSLAIGPVQNSNLWINSDGGINQRVAASTADGAYGFDRAVVLCDGGSVTLSQLAQPTDGIPYAMRMLQPDASPKRMGKVQIVEARDCLAYRGKNLVFAPKFRCSASVTIRVALVAWTSTADAPTKDVVNSWTSTTYTAGNFFVTNTTPIAVGSAALTAATWADVAVSSASAGGVAAPSAMNNLYLVWWTDTAVAQNVTLDTSVIRAGQGTVLPIWTPPDAQVELARCQRYYQTSYDGVAAGSASAASNRRVALSTSATTPGVQFHVTLPVSMRATPTVTLYNPNTGASGTMRNESAGSDLAAGFFGTTGSNYFAVWNSAAATALTNIYSIHYTAYSEIGV